MKEELNQVFNNYKQSTEGGGLRFNDGKLRYDLVNPEAHEGMVDILTFGAQKYADRNWELGMGWSKIISSLKRHIAAYEKGEDYDKESGRLHADHIACNAHFLSAYYRIFPQGDDRPHKYLKPKKIGLDIDGVLADFVGGMMDKFPDEVTDRSIFWNDFGIRDHFNIIAKDRTFWLQLNPLLNPNDLPIEPTCYITSRPIDSEISEEWLRQNGFPKAKVYTVDNGQSKVAVAKEAGIDIFVDDCYSNFTELSSNGIFTYLFDAPYNRRYDVGYRRIYSLKDIK